MKKLIMCYVVDIQVSLLITTVIRKAECSDSRGMRYETDWLLHCTILRIKSPAAYEHLKVHGILPLPDKSMIKRIISHMPCQMGFNEFALKAIKIALKKLPRSLRYGSLVWDEMSLAQSVNFNAQLLKMDGFVDYGGAIKKKYVKHEGQLADHALVFLFRPYRASWVQPIAVFGTKGAAGADVLQQLILKAIVMLEKCNAHVLNVVSDGAQTNKSTYKKFGISGAKDDVRFYIEHPLDPNQKVFFIFDVPHLLKVIRNHLFNHKNV